MEERHTDRCGQAMLRRRLQTSAAVRYVCLQSTSTGRSALESLLSGLSMEFLRSQLKGYLAAKNEYCAETDTQLILSILQGYVARWPLRGLSNGALSQIETISFIAEIIKESNSQLAHAGFSRKVARQNLSYISNVIEDFFVPSGVFVSLDQP